MSPSIMALSSNELMPCLLCRQWPKGYKSSEVSAGNANVIQGKGKKVTVDTPRNQDSIDCGKGYSRPMSYIIPIANYSEVGQKQEAIRRVQGSQN